MESETLTVVDSDLGRIPAGTELTVTKHRINEFTGDETITVEADPVPDDRLGPIDMFPTDTKDVLKEIVVGRESDTVVVKRE